MWNHRVELLAYHDLDGRSGFKLALQEVEGRFFLYVAGLWHSGWSILEVTDPEHPKLLRFVEGPANTMTIQVQVADRVMITGFRAPFLRPLRRLLRVAFLAFRQRCRAAPGRLSHLGRQGA